jgi:hypothetical protein
VNELKDPTHGNAAALFASQTGGDPTSHPYPTAAELGALRLAAELPVCSNHSCPVTVTSDECGADVGARMDTGTDIGTKTGTDTGARARARARTNASAMASANASVAVGNDGGMQPVLSAAKARHTRGSKGTWSSTSVTSSKRACGAPVGAATTAVRVAVPLPQPSVVLVHICLGSRAAPTTPPTGLRLRTTQTPGQVFVRWDDVISRCVSTYEVLYSPSSATKASGPFVRVNHADTLFSAHVHQQRAAMAATKNQSGSALGGRGAGPGTRAVTGIDAGAKGGANARTMVAVGCYKIRMVDYYGQSSPSSAAVCFGRGRPGTPQPPSPSY